LNSLTCPALLILLACAPATGDEGMWLYNHPPRELLRDRHGFEPTSEWLEHLQKSSVNFGGGSGEFVSPEGLLLSNQHVASRTLQRLSSPEHNYVRDGFHARTRAAEMPCPGLELTVLMSIEEVTDRVQAAVKPGMTDAAAFAARRAAIAQLERESQEQTGFRSQVVTLYQGAEYHLYRFKRLTDIRLVFAPEEQIAFFGGDADNFEYPRFDLDITFFRAYENGRPLRPEHFLKWSLAGAAENELVFVSGHPARTERLRTVAELKYLRDVEYPRGLEKLKRNEVLLAAYAKRSLENERRARADLRGVENGRKRRDGTLAGLLDPELLEKKQAEEDRLRQAAASDPSLKDAAGAWERIARAQQEIAIKSLEYDLLEGGSAFNTPLFLQARRLVRAASEKSKPDGERLEEFRSPGLPSLEIALGAEQPFYADLETLKLADSLTYLVEKLGFTNALTQRILAGKSPRERATELVSRTTLGSASVRRELFSKGEAALTDPDPLLELARGIDGEARALRKTMETQREAIRQAHGQIGKVRYALHGSGHPPDATGTLRLSFGTVRGYAENETRIPFQTTMAGLFDRANARQFKPPFDLPARWMESRRKLKLSTPFNFVCTADTIGGNSGSPVVNRSGELVGVLFDGNIHSLVRDVAYSDDLARSVSVHSSGIIEALRAVYKADGLIKELLGEVNPR
jgi:hypothetical protein